MAEGADDAALLAEIARLSSQIEQHRNQAATQAQQPVPHHYRGRGGYTYRGRGSSWNAGRGGAASSGSRHRTLVINHSNGNASATSSSAPSSETDQSPRLAPASTVTDTQQRWVKRKTTHNMSLVSSSTFEKTEPARIAALQASQEAKAKARAEKVQAKSQRPSKPHKPSADVRRGDNMGEVIIDGVVFVFDETGTKLVKKPSQPSETDTLSEDHPSTSTAAASPSKAPLRTSVNGQAFVRTKGGNLISAELAEKRKAHKESQAKLKKMERLGQQIGHNERVRSANRKPGAHTPATKGPKGLCSFFTKTGQCKRGLSCPYQHDASKLAICPGALRPSGCNQPPGMCPLSHQLSPHRVPHCVHFLRSSGRTCRNGDECLYVHPPVSADISQTSPVCMPFAKVGWCSNGKECTHRHTFDCPDFLERGSCDRKGCKLQHVIRPGDVAAGGSGPVAEEPSTLLPPPPPPRQNRTRAQPALISGVGVGEGRKRKSRPSVDGVARDSSASSDDDAGEEEAEEGGALSFATDARKKRRKAKGFTEQKDYIGFDDEDDEEEEDSDEDGGGGGGDVDDGDDGTSVSSGSSEDEDEDEEDSGSDSDSD